MFEEYGKVASCMQGKVGIITGKRLSVLEGGWIYKGVNLFGKPWQSKKPTILASCILEWTLICHEEHKKMLEEMNGTVAQQVEASALETEQ